MADTVLDTSSTTGVLTSTSFFVNGTIDATPESGSFDTTLDHDWYAVTLTADHTYTFSAFTTAGPLNDVAIVLRDANRNILNSHRVVDGGPNGQASFRYSTTVSGTFYLDVSAGGSNPVGVVGSYQAIFSDNGADTILDTPPKTGSFDTSRDRDWLAVTLIAGHTYQFQAFALSGSLNDVAIDLRDANRNIVNSQGVVDAGAFGRPTFTYSATVGGTFYLDISAGGSNPAGVTG